MVPHKNDPGYTNLDFLVGSSIFLLTFMYVFTFVPNLFTPYQAGAIDLGSVVYRTGAVLVEDPGWYIYTQNGTQMGNPSWEQQDISRLARIGLADDRTTPNVLSIDKIRAMAAITDYDLVRDKIGLNSTVRYNYTLSLTMNDALTGGQAELLNKTTIYQNNNVEYMERNVLIDTGKELYVDAGYPSGSGVAQSSVLKVSLANMTSDDTHNATLRLFNVTGTHVIRSVNWWQDPEGPLVPLIDNNQYYVRKNGLSASMPVTFNQSDIIEIAVQNSAIQAADVRHIWVIADSNVFPGVEVDYFHDPVYRLKSVCYPGLFRLEVWSDVL